MAAAYVAVRYLSLKGKTSKQNSTTDKEVLNFIARNLKLFKTKLELFIRHYNLSGTKVKQVELDLDFIVKMKLPANVDMIESKLEDIVKITPPGYEVIENDGEKVRKSLSAIKLPSKANDRGLSCNAKFGRFNLPETMPIIKRAGTPSRGVSN